MKSFLTILLILFSVSVFSQPPGYEWIKKYATDVQEAAYSLDEDQWGNIYIAASFTDTIILNEEPVISNGGTDALLMKCNSDGEILWFKTIGGDSDDNAIEVNCDSEGNPVVSGIFHSHSVSIGDTTLNSCGCWEFSFVSKFSSEGELLWVHSVVGEGAAIISDQDLSSDNSVYITGAYYMDTYFVTDTVYSAGSSDIFLAKFTSDGGFEWVKTFGYNGSEYGWTVELDNNDFPVVSGYFEKKVQFGSDTLSSTGYYDIFIVKTDENGEVIWSKRAGGTMEDQGIDLAIDKENNIYLTGFFSGTAWFEDFDFTSEGNYDSYIAMFDENGVYIRAATFSGTDHEMGFKVEVDENLNVYSSGQFMGEVSFLDTVLVSIDYLDTYLIKLDPEWNRVWLKKVDGINEQKITDIHVSGNDSLYLCMTFSGETYINDDTLACLGWDDFLVAKILPDSLLTFSGFVTDEHLLIYPNPAYNEIFITENEPTEFIIYSTSGTIILSGTTKNNERIDISDISSGLYFIQLTNSKTRKTGKFVKTVN